MDRTIRGQKKVPVIETNRILQFDRAFVQEKYNRWVIVQRVWISEKALILLACRC